MRRKNIYLHTIFCASDRWSYTILIPDNPSMILRHVTVISVLSSGRDSGRISLLLI